MLSQIRIKGKRGISVMIGYVLLVTFAIIISVVVYSWMKSYVPSEDVDCEDGVSLMIYDYNCNNEVLNISFRNSGRFSLAGFTIYGKNSSDVEIATIDLSKKLIGIEDDPYINASGRVYFGEGVNSLPPGGFFPLPKGSFIKFNISSYNSLPEIELTPVRSIERNNKNIMAVCGNARIEETINCGRDDSYSCECSGGFVQLYSGIMNCSDFSENECNNINISNYNYTDSETNHNSPVCPCNEDNETGGCGQQDFNTTDYVGSNCYDNYINSSGSDVSYTYTFDENSTFLCQRVC